jgi:hypothetical protein
MTKYFMLDIETLALTADAEVWAVALTEFSLHAAESHTHMFLLAPQRDRLWQSATAEWTKMHGDKDLFAKWEEGAAGQLLTPMQLYEALNAVLGAYGNENYEVWAKGAKVDFAIMQSYFNDYVLPTPWHYRAERDLRTLQSVCKSLGMPEADLEYNKPLIPHNAASDAEAQARTAARWLGYCQSLPRLS